MQITKLFNAIESNTKTWTSILALLVGLSPVSAMANGLDTTSNYTSLPFSVSGTQIMHITASGLTIDQGAITTSGNEIISNIGSAAANFRLIGGSYGAMLRNDGANTYLLLTAAGSQYGTWTGARPFYVNDVGGQVTMASTVTISGGTGALLVPSLTISSGGENIQAGGLNVLGGVQSDTLALTTSLTIPATGYGITAPAYYHNSDARLKTSIHPIDNALDKLLSIRGVEFNWKKDGHADMGVVAQNVAEVFPNVISKDSNGIMSVEYDSLVGPMIEAIRTLKADNDDLRQKVQALDDMKAQMTQIRDSLQALKQENAQLRSIKLDSDGSNIAIKSSSSVSP